MLIFGPYAAIPKDVLPEEIDIFNLSSPNQRIPRLPGLLVTPDQRVMYDSEGTMEKSFDMWYYDYVLNDMTACSSLMTILASIYSSKLITYVCIADYSDGLISVVNESFMKLIQARYDIKYSIINTQEDFQYVAKDGCDFASVAGIKTFDQDLNRFMRLVEEQRLMNGGSINAEW